MNSTRSDIAYVVTRLSRYTHNPDKNHWIALDRIARYLKGTIDYGLTFGSTPPILEGYSDANWISDSDEIKSTSGYIFTLGGDVVSWKSSKQTCIARSTMESEFITLEKTCYEAEWLRNLLADLPIETHPHVQYQSIVIVRP
ncbi:secreted RxLR effector protein 161-like [Pistacia vera]|uniref:secreted RxLR effector protein 161-like n=1 Tax=Pistacia vera TaxID=55513 RepID=UPI001262BF2A|nr:secreted RxLR effector protein 161-like [Pistacia vera]